MSQLKLRQARIGQTKAAMTRLKELPAADRAKVQEILHSHTYRDAEPMVRKLVGFACSVDVLCRFFSWQAAQEDLEVSKDMLRQVLSFVSENYNDWTEEKMRETATGFFTLHTMANRDVKGFASMARLYLQADRCRMKARKLELEEVKFKESSRRKLEAGLDALAKAFKKKPEALRLYQQARELIESNDQAPRTND